MRTLYLPAPSSKNEQANLQPTRVVETIAPLRRGTVLAGRYKILATIEAGTFRAHDLALDQTVMVRQASGHQVVAEFWQQENQKPALIRDPHLLNVLDVVSENSNEFTITEWSKGRSVGDILGEQSSGPWAGGWRASPPTTLVPRNAVLPPAREVIRKFDRDTGWVATAVLAMVIFGAVGLAIQIKERHLNARNSDNSTVFLRGIERTSRQPSSQITSIRLQNIDLALTKVSPPDPSWPMETPAPTSAKVSVLTFTKGSHYRKVDPTPWIPTQRLESSRETRSKVPSTRTKSSVRPKIVDVKKRLVALWRASLVRDKRTSGWNISENSRKNVSYTAEIAHGG